MDFHDNQDVNTTNLRLPICLLNFFLDKQTIFRFCLDLSRQNRQFLISENRLIFLNYNNKKQ